MIRHNRTDVTLNSTEVKIRERFEELLDQGHGIAHAAMLALTEFKDSNSEAGKWYRVGWKDRFSPQFVDYLSDHTVKFYPLTLTLLYVKDAPVNDGCPDVRGLP